MLLIRLADEWVIDETLAVELRTVVIACGQLQTAKIQLTCDTVGQKVVIIIKHITCYSRQWRADTIRIRHLTASIGVAGAAYSILCRAVAVDEGDIAITVDKFLTG